MARTRSLTLFVLLGLACFPTAGVARTVTEIIFGPNTLYLPFGIAVDASGNAYVTGNGRDNAFKITPDGVITEIIDVNGDGMGNMLRRPWGIAVDDSGNAYVTGTTFDNAFKITPDGVITEIIDSTGDGIGNTLDWPQGIAVDDSGNAYVTGSSSYRGNAFKITPDGVITEIIDSTGDGIGNPLNVPSSIAADDAGNLYVAGGYSDNAFKIELCDTLYDYPLFEDCLTGPAGLVDPSCACPDDDADGDVDLADYARFQLMFTGM